ncbi:MAG: HU family DNA-binding protein [Bacteroides sp.]|nr:HU family DNA-binding protein [Bacteroides sp.]
MSAIYDFKPVPGQDPDQENPLLHPYLISAGTVPYRKILEEICRASTLTVADLEGALTALSEYVLRYLNYGYRVELGHFGYFSAGIKADRLIRDRREVHSISVRFDSIHFRASSSFRKQLNGKLRLARSGNHRVRSSKLSDAECRGLLLAYLEDHPFITRTEYSALTGKLKNTAIRQLRRFIAEGVILCRGSHNHLRYMLPDRK